MDCPIVIAKREATIRPIHLIFSCFSFFILPDGLPGFRRDLDGVLIDKCHTRHRVTALHAEAWGNLGFVATVFFPKVERLTVAPPVGNSRIL